MNKSDRIYYPPGGILIWFIIIIEMLTFIGAIIAFSYQRSVNIAEFNEARAGLNLWIGTGNTLVLITSGYFMARSLKSLELKNLAATRLFLLLTISLGLLFLLIKGGEYVDKVNHGHTLGAGTYYTFFWLMTGFHYVHVLFGVAMLAFTYFRFNSGHWSEQRIGDFETMATYWHMCDLIWIFIFPILYLL